MPDKKLTDSEIVKEIQEIKDSIKRHENLTNEIGQDLLQIDSEYTGGKRVWLETKFFQKVFKHFCHSNFLVKTLQYALDLINRQEEEKQNLKYDYDNLQRQFDEIYQQFHYLSNVEIPYLYSFTEDKDKKLETIANILLRTKAEAYKEAFEKAKLIISDIVDLIFDDNISKCQLSNCHKPSNIPCENEICIQENKEYWHSKLDNLLNELVGDENAERK